MSAGSTLTEPSQFDGSNAGTRFVFNKGTSKVSTTVSRFGVMFFSSPADGVREMLRVLKPGGKLALGVWCSAERNPFHSALSRVVRKHVGSPPPDRDAPDAFRFATEGKLRDLLVDAGVPNPVEHPYPQVPD